MVAVPVKMTAISVAPMARMTATMAAITVTRSVITVRVTVVTVVAVNDWYGVRTTHISDIDSVTYLVRDKDHLGVPRT